MCQLLGVSFNQQVQPAQLLKTFFENSIFHPHGWGIAFYPSDSKQSVLFKEACPAYDSDLAKFLLSYQHLQSKTLIAHIRKATRGSLTHDNTHPFSRCCQGREFIFAHNGTFTKTDQFPHLIYQPIGQTDSERAFCYLLTLLSMREIRRTRYAGVNGYTARDFAEIHKILHNINTEAAGSFNCLFSDGEYLFCYRDLQEARNLFYLRAKKQNPSTRSQKISINKNRHEEPVERQGYIVATEPCTKGNWQPFAGGQLMVFQDGQLVADLH